MSPTSRNTVMIGGALILIALLLVCGPLSGQFGSGGSSVEEAPSVAAGPPAAEHTGALGAAAVGALAGASLGESGEELMAPETPVAVVAEPEGELAVVAAEVEDEPDQGAGLVVPAPAVAVVAAGAAVAVAADGIGGGSGLGAPATEAPLGAVEFAPPTPAAADLPAVGAAGPSISDVMEVAATPGLGAGVTAAGFDRAMAAAARTNAGVGTAGKVVNRFAPPVAAPPQANLNVAASLDAGPLIKPCDTPGSGCRNLASGSPPPTGGNPPIIPGRLPPQP